MAENLASLLFRLQILGSNIGLGSIIPYKIRFCRAATVLFYIPVGASQTLKVTAGLEMKESVSLPAVMFPIHHTQPSNHLLPYTIMHAVKRSLLIY